MGDRRHQGIALGGADEVLGRLLGAVVELAHVHVQADRDGTLVQVEGFLKLRCHDGGGHVLLGLRVGRVLQLEHGEAVDVEGEVARRARGGGAQEVLAGNLARGNEFALGPVAHQLHARFALDDHRGGQVPVTAGGVLVGVVLDMAEGREGLLHGRALESGRVELHQGLLVEVGAAHPQRDRFERGEILPVLAAVRDRDDASLLQLLGGDEKFVPGRGHLGAGLLQCVGVGPEPVDTVHVDRDSDIAALVLHHVGDDLGQQAVPVVGLGDVVEVGEHAFGAPFLDRRALDLRRGGRVARDDAGLEHRHRRVTAAAGDREILPGVAFGLQGRFQRGGGLGLAAGGPVVQDLDFASAGCGAEGEQGRAGRDGPEGSGRDQDAGHEVSV